MSVVSKYAKAWNDWESSIIMLEPEKPSEIVTDYDIAIARMECHYFYNNSFIPENYILNNIDKIENIKTYICHGRYDVDCRPSGAYELSKKLKNCKLDIIELAGHSSRELPIASKLIEITDMWDDKPWE